MANTGSSREKEISLFPQDRFQSWFGAKCTMQSENWGFVQKSRLMHGRNTGFLIAQMSEMECPASSTLLHICNGALSRTQELLIMTEKK
jgi:hypothetical protein